MLDLNFAKKFTQYAKKAQQCHDLRLEGRLVRMVGLTLEAVGCVAPVGSKCIVTGKDCRMITAEVVGFSDNKLYLMTTDTVHGLEPGARITPIGQIAEVGVSWDLLGRVLDGTGKPLDGKGAYEIDDHYSLHGVPINPLERACIRSPLDVGVRAINALATIGRGQRMGMFAASGVGKSMLLGMMTRFTEADVIVVAMIGERGREVKEFIEDILGEVGMRRSVVIASPADTSPLVRLHGAMRATSIAEYFRDQGAQVLLLMDSLTRFAQAQRELALAIGEPPATRGYPPSVFTKLSSLVERAGNAQVGQGSITAFYTVLVEGDEQFDPIGEAVQSYLDGHLRLSAKLADQGIYPAIDIEKSISRVMHSITDDHHQLLARRFKHYYAKYNQAQDLINLGAYQSGADRELDQAIVYYPAFLAFLSQIHDVPCTMLQSLKALEAVFSEDTV